MVSGELGSEGAEVQTNTAVYMTVTSGHGDVRHGNIGHDFYNGLADVFSEKIGPRSESSSYPGASIS